MLEEKSEGNCIIDNCKRFSSGPETRPVLGQPSRPSQWNQWAFSSKINLPER